MWSVGATSPRLRRSAIVVGMAMVTALFSGLAVVSPARPAAAAGSTVFQGAFVCSAGGAPLAGARVELWEQWDTWLPKLAPNAHLRHVVTADANGGWGFRVTGGETNWFIRVVLTSAQAEVSDFLVPWNYFADTAPNQNDVAVHDYGTQAVRGLECPLWTRMHAAGLGYERDVGARAPFGELETIYNSPAAGKPYTWYDEVRWPFALSPAGTTPMHEFAHAFRHTLDGSFGHFFGDMVAFQYPQHHYATSCEKRTNPGFAFNEGWAQYWAGTRSTPCPDRPGDFSIERNVAAGLRGLQRTCDLSRADMVGVLAANPGRIHSYQAFSNRARCTRRLPVPPVSAVTPQEVTAGKVRSALRYGRSWLRAVTRERSRLRGEVVSALSTLQTPLPCATRPCAEELRRVAEPWLARARLAQVEAIVRKFAGVRKPRVVRALLRRPTAATRHWDRKQRQALAVGRKAALSHLDAAIAAVAAVPGAPSPLHDRSASALATLRAGFATGNTTALAANTWQPSAGPTRVGSTPAAVHIVDVAGPPEASTTTLDGCTSPPPGSYSMWFPSPGDANYPGPPAVHGSVLPARAGTPVDVVYTYPTDAGEAVLVGSTTTDASGRFSHGITQQQWAAGYGRVWKIQADFDGDSTRFASVSQFCLRRAAYP